jgi:hypothetical protein
MTANTMAASDRKASRTAVNRLRKLWFIGKSRRTHFRALQ